MRSFFGLAAACVAAVAIGRAAADSLLDAGSYGDAAMCPGGFNFGGTELVADADVLQLPEAARGFAVDPEVGYTVENIAEGTYVITEGVYICMFVVTDEGVVLFDAPETMAAFIMPAIGSVTDKSVSHLVYSHTHQDHIAGAGALSLPDDVIIIGNSYTGATLTALTDPKRPPPTVTFDEEYLVAVGGVDIELLDTPNGHTPGDIFMYLPQVKVVMVVDVVFPGWVPFRAFAIAENFPLYVETLKEFIAFDAEQFVCGHLNKVGTRTDMEHALEFVEDVEQAAADTLATEDISVAEIAARTLVPSGGNAFLFANELERVRQDYCYNLLAPKWAGVLGAFDVFTRSHCSVAMAFLRLE